MPRGIKEYIIKDGKVYHIVRLDGYRRITLPKEILEQIEADAFIVIPESGKIVLEPVKMDVLHALKKLREIKKPAERDRDVL